MNQTVLIGTVVEKFELPNDDIFGIELECGNTKFIIHMPKNMYDAIDLPQTSLTGVRGHLYHFNNNMYVYADKLFLL